MAARPCWSRWRGGGDAATGHDWPRLGDGEVRVPHLALVEAEMEQKELAAVERSGGAWVFRCACGDRDQTDESRRTRDSRQS